MYDYNNNNNNRRSYLFTSILNVLHVAECINEAAQSIHIPRLKLEYAHNQVNLNQNS